MTPEEKARVKIDQMFKDAGWKVVDRDLYTPTLTAAAIREGLLQGNREADYFLFINGKAFAYSRTDSEGTSIDSYSHYYSVIDLKNCTSTRLTFNGKQLPYSGGRFSQRSVVVNGKVYFGINAENETNSQIYIYDALTGEVTKGAEVDGSHFFDMIRVIKN